MEIAATLKKPNESREKIMLRHTHVGSCNVNTLSRSPPSQLPPSPSVSISASLALAPCPLLRKYLRR